jgi:hypothetical protein
MFRLPRRLLHGCAALLALALSAFGGARLGVERALTASDPNDERPAIAPAVAHVAVVAAVVAAEDSGIEAAPAEPCVHAPGRAQVDLVPCALLLGSALGPRAP